MADLKPDATMREHECWCADKPEAPFFSRWDGAQWVLVWKDQPEETAAYPWGDDIRFCGGCASELHREGALAGWAGPPQERILADLKRFRDTSAGHWEQLARDAIALVDQMRPYVETVIALQEGYDRLKEEWSSHV